MAALGREKPTLTYRPPAGDDERPVATEIVVGPQGSDFAFRVEFDRVPWGEECKNRCANATVFVDTDSNKATGLQLNDKTAAETGADLAVTIQGVREFKDVSADVLLRVRVRVLSDANASADEGEMVGELDHRRDPDRVHVDGKTVYVLVDATTGSLPTGPKMRVIYHPPGAKALVGTIKGQLAMGAGKVEIFKQGKRAK